MTALRARKKSSHKGQNGIVLVIGGSEDYIGAPALVGQAALAILRAGADLVTIASVEKVAWAINRIAPDLITRKLPGKRWSLRHMAALRAMASSADVIVIGNGMDLLPMTQSVIRAFVRWCAARGKNILIDATALRVVRIQDCSDAIFTPHAAEMKTLLKHSKLSVTDLPRALGEGVLVQKGHPVTILRSARKTVRIKAGHPGMTHGGTGDVLAGVIAALWAEGNDRMSSCEIAVKANGRAAALLGTKLGFGYIASDIVKALPIALKRHWR